MCLERKACRRYRPGKHMDVDGTGIKVGDTVSLSCHADYEMPEGGTSRTVICQNDGRWSDNPKCKRGSCFNCFSFAIVSDYKLEK